MTSSVDTSVRLWSMTKGTAYKTFLSHPTLVITVKILPPEACQPWQEDPEESGQAKTLLLTMSRDDIHVFRWNDLKELQGITEPERQVRS